MCSTHWRLRQQTCPLSELLRQNEKTIKAAFKDVYLVTDEDFFAKLVHEADGVRDNILHALISSNVPDTDFTECLTVCQRSADTNFDATLETNIKLFELGLVTDDPLCENTSVAPHCQDDTFKTSGAVNEGILTETVTTDTVTEQNTDWKVGAQKEVFWPLHNAYYLGIVFEEGNINKTVVFKDGEIETHIFAIRTWRYASSAEVHAVFAALVILHSDVNNLLTLTFKHYGNKSFLRNKPQ